MMYLRQKAAYCAAFWELTKKPGDSDAWIGFLLRMDFVLGKRPTPYLNTLMAASPMQPRRKCTRRDDYLIKRPKFVFRYGWGVTQK